MNAYSSGDCRLLVPWFLYVTGNVFLVVNYRFGMFLKILLQELGKVSSMDDILNAIP
ncbi:hypothetical protein Golax_018670, partial [Gossypium laxum]|nr:hypothetical protein [Gossypium laxum]